MSDKEKFGHDMQAQLEKWKKRIEESEDKAEQQGESFFKKMTPDLETLRGGYDRARLRFKLFTMSGGDALDEIREGFERALAELSAAYSRAVKKFEK